MTKKRRKDSRKHRRLFKWLLVLPLMDIGPIDLLGETHDEQLEEIAEILGEIEQPALLGELFEDDSGFFAQIETASKSEQKDLKARIAEWLSSHLP